MRMIKTCPIKRAEMSNPDNDEECREEVIQHLKEQSGQIAREKCSQAGLMIWECRKTE